MTVRVSKPEFNLREKISELDKPVGSKGSQLMKSETVQDARDFIGAGRKNLFINGALNIAQRGDSIASAFTYSMDQWYLMNHGSTTTRETSSPPEGFTYYARFASANTVVFQHNLELPRQGYAGYLQGKTVTVSFYARTETNATAYVYVDYRNNAGGGDWTQVYDGKYEITPLTSRWKRYSRTFTIGATPHANNKCMAVIIRNPSGQTSGTWEIAGLQMEFGSTATEFEHRPVAEELALCQRYFQVMARGYISPARGNSASSYLWTYECPVPFRALPTVSTQTWSGASFSARRFRDGTGVSDSTSAPSPQSAYFYPDSGTSYVHFAQGGYTGADDRSAVIMIQQGAIFLSAEL